MSPKTITKKAASRKPPAAKKVPAKRRARPAPVAAHAPKAEPARAVVGYDEDDVMLHGGGSRGASFGRCGGRLLGSRIEQDLCTRLSLAGVTHSHAPRHFEVNLADKQVAAYAPMIVLRGRGREGKTVVIEAAEAFGPNLDKIKSFRAQYGPEFYVIFVAPEDFIDEVPIQAYDESCTTSNVHTLVNRLAD
jgi:hypothetical protein